jgi:hypothetical protein
MADGVSWSELPSTLGCSRDRVEEPVGSQGLRGNRAKGHEQEQKNPGPQLGSITPRSGRMQLLHSACDTQGRGQRGDTRGGVVRASLAAQ